jgi:hypothetical protein
MIQAHSNFISCAKAKGGNGKQDGSSNVSTLGVIGAAHRKDYNLSSHQPVDFYLDGDLELMKLVHSPSKVPSILRFAKLVTAINVHAVKPVFFFTTRSSLLKSDEQKLRRLTSREPHHTRLTRKDLTDLNAILVSNKWLGFDVKYALDGVEAEKCAAAHLARVEPSSRLDCIVTGDSDIIPLLTQCKLEKTLVLYEVLAPKGKYSAMAFRHTCVADFKETFKETTNWHPAQFVLLAALLPNDFRSFVNTETGKVDPHITRITGLSFKKLIPMIASLNGEDFSEFNLSLVGGREGLVNLFLEKCPEFKKLVTATYPDQKSFRAYIEFMVTVTAMFHLDPINDCRLSAHSVSAAPVDVAAAPVDVAAAAALEQVSVDISRSLSLDYFQDMKDVMEDKSYATFVGYRQVAKPSQADDKHHHDADEHGDDDGEHGDDGDDDDVDDAAAAADEVVVLVSKYAADAMEGAEDRLSAYKDLLHRCVTTHRLVVQQSLPLMPPNPPVTPPLPPQQPQAQPLPEFDKVIATMPTLDLRVIKVSDAIKTAAVDAINCVALGEYLLSLVDSANGHDNVTSLSLISIMSVDAHALDGLSDSYVHVAIEMGILLLLRCEFLLSKAAIKKPGMKKATVDAASDRLASFRKSVHGVKQCLLAHLQSLDVKHRHKLSEMLHKSTLKYKLIPSAAVHAAEYVDCDEDNVVDGDGDGDGDAGDAGDGDAGDGDAAHTNPIQPTAQPPVYPTVEKEKKHAIQEQEAVVKAIDGSYTTTLKQLTDDIIHPFIKQFGEKVQSFPSQCDRRLSNIVLSSAVRDMRDKSDKLLRKFIMVSAVHIAPYLREYEDTSDDLKDMPIKNRATLLIEQGKLCAAQYLKLLQDEVHKAVLAAVESCGNCLDNERDANKATNKALNDLAPKLLSIEDHSTWAFVVLATEFKTCFNSRWSEIEHCEQYYTQDDIDALRTGLIKANLTRFEEYRAAGTQDGHGRLQECMAIHRRPVPEQPLLKKAIPRRDGSNAQQDTTPTSLLDSASIELFALIEQDCYLWAALKAGFLLLITDLQIYHFDGEGRDGEGNIRINGMYNDVFPGKDFIDVCDHTKMLTVAMALLSAHGYEGGREGSSSDETVRLTRGITAFIQMKLASPVATPSTSSSSSSSSSLTSTPSSTYYYTPLFDALKERTQYVQEKCFNTGLRVFVENQLLGLSANYKKFLKMSVARSVKLFFFGLFSPFLPLNVSRSLSKCIKHSGHISRVVNFLTGLCLDQGASRAFLLSEVRLIRIRDRISALTGIDIAFFSAVGVSVAEPHTKTRGEDFMALMPPQRGRLYQGIDSKSTSIKCTSCVVDLNTCLHRLYSVRHSADSPLKLNVSGNGAFDLCSVLITSTIFDVHILPSYKAVQSRYGLTTATDLKQEIQHVDSLFLNLRSTRFSTSVQLTGSFQTDGVSLGCLKKEVYNLSDKDAEKQEVKRIAAEEKKQTKKAQKAEVAKGADQGKGKGKEKGKKTQQQPVKPDEETEQLGEGEGGMMNGEGTLLPVEWPPRKSGPPIVTVGAIMKSCASRRGLYWCFNGTAGSASVGNLVRHEAVQDAVNAERNQLRKKSLKLAQKQRKAEKKKLAADAQV